MSSQDRWIFAITLVLADIVAIFIPLAAVVGAYVVIARPPWFREWTDKLYAD